MSLVDPYFDESIGDLRNLLGAKSSIELEELESLKIPSQFASFEEMAAWHEPLLDVERTNKSK